jgi:hypothetical protein
MQMRTAFLDLVAMLSVTLPQAMPALAPLVDRTPNVGAITFPLNARPPVDESRNRPDGCRQRHLKAGSLR